VFTAPRLKAPTSYFACSSNFWAWNQRDITENSRLSSARETLRCATKSEHEIQT
jgi:hypothetical protein